MLAPENISYRICSLSSGCFLSLSLYLAPLNFSATLLPFFILLALYAISLFSASFSVQRLAVFGAARRGVPSNEPKRFSRHYFESGGHAFARAKSHLHGSLREGHALSHRLMSFLIFFKRKYEKETRAQGRESCDERRRHIEIIRKQQLILLQSQITISLLQKGY